MRHWAQGGPTTLANLLLLCRRHHRAVHEQGYQVARGPDGALQFTRPDGRPLPAVPPVAAVLADPVGALRVRHDTRACACTRGRDCPDGSGSAWTWAGRSTCCTRWRHAVPDYVRHQMAEAC
ncbi:MAG: HNH endonuclease signature motif containing protein, partial [Candidatus Rokuibacteriota bacterium]